MVFQKQDFEKLILKKISRRQKSMKNFPGGEKLIVINTIFILLVHKILMNRLNKTNSAVSNPVGSLYFWRMCF